MPTKKKPTKTEASLRGIVGGKLSELATYSHLFENTADAIFLLDLETCQVLECNPVAKAVLPNSSDGENFLDLLRESDRSAVETIFRSLLASQKSSAPVDAAVNGQEWIWEISACRLKLADYCEVIQVIARDVTAARLAARELLAANKKLADLSNTDGLTGLFNIRFFRAELAKEHERSTRYQKPFSVILCDIDHFKHFNDRNGHPAGDEALKGVGAKLKARARRTDTVARYGGEEFVILCPEVEGEKAKLLADAIRETIAAQKFPHGEAQPLGFLSLSIGVASFPEHGKTPEEVIECADQALYVSKKAGRNSVTLFTGAKKKAA